MIDDLYNKYTGVTHIKENYVGNWWVVGDIHGRYDQLERQLHEVGFDYSRDTLFALGDLVDRGNKSWECFQLLDKPWFNSILGNHEELMWRGIHGANTIDWIHNGGNWWWEGKFNELDGNTNSVADSAKKAILNLPNYRTLIVNSKTIGLVHANAGRIWPPVKTKLSVYDDPTIWDRTFLYSTVKAVKGADLIIVGHNPTKEVAKQNNTLHIDTGYASGKLSILNIEDLINEEWYSD